MSRVWTRKEEGREVFVSHAVGLRPAQNIDKVSDPAARGDLRTKPSLRLCILLVIFYHFRAERRAAESPKRMARR